MLAKIALLPGDGIGPEIVAATRTILEQVAALNGHTFEMQPYPIGGCAMDEHGSSLPPATLAACAEADAVLLGAVGGPKLDDPNAADRPETGLLGIRKGLALFANLRPVRTYPALTDASPLRPERLAGVDLMVVRELTGGLYFGQPKLRRPVGDEIEAIDTMSYTTAEIRRVAHVAFQLAQVRRGKLTSVDKANVIECSRLWRATVTEVAQQYPGVQVEHILADSAAMYLMTRPASFDVIVTENTFGDILTDEASVLSGSMGVLPSASLGETRNRHGGRLGLYEPIHGSAPDIAGQGLANPIGTILSAAMLLRYSLNLEAEARLIEDAVDTVINAGLRTRDLAVSGEPFLTTAEMTDAILAQLEPVY
jgi:3-isopropylmalate dehydrogenase